MREFVQYHNTEAMGQPCTEIADFDVFTNKPVSGLMGDAIWLVAGEGTRPRRYYLAYRFVVDEAGDCAGPGFRYYAKGAEGIFFRPPIRLDGSPWWPDFLRSQNNFSLGLREIAPQYVMEFQTLAASYRAEGAQGLGSVTREQVLHGIERFDRELRASLEWETWHQKLSYKYAIRSEGRWYPPKIVISLGSGIPRSDFSGGVQAANRILRGLGFDVIEIPRANDDELEKDEGYLRPGDAEDERGTDTTVEPYIPHDYDGRERVYRSIRARRGQQAFRTSLRNRYGDQCQISGCDLLDLLEAAHIRPYRDENDNHEENGLILRADLHTLFDLDLIAIEPDALAVRVHPVAQAAGYDRFEGQKLRCTEGRRPSKAALEERWKLFTARAVRQ